MKLYSIGQASEMIGVPIATIRYYESVQLCTPSFTDVNTGYRYYSIDDIFKLDLIRCLGRQLGMPLKQIRSFLKESQDPEAIVKYLQQQEVAIDRDIEKLTRRRTFISDKLLAIKEREDLTFLEPCIARQPELRLYGHHIEADCMEDAILMARKAVGGAADNCREIYLILDKTVDSLTCYTNRCLIVGFTAPIGEAPFELSLPEGLYAGIYYPNRDEYRGSAFTALENHIRENGLSPCGPLICSGSLIDTTSASSLDYVIRLRIQVC